MKFNFDHKQKYIGASGVCKVCGLSVTLDKNDKKPSHHVIAGQDVWIVDCPKCYSPIRCTKEELSE